MKCQLEIEHSKVKEKYRNTLIFCPLLAKDKGSLTELGVICANCCFRTQQIGDVLSDLILRRVIEKDDVKYDQHVFADRLEPELKEYAEVISKASGKTWLEIPKVCKKCKATPVVPTTPPKAEPTEMTQVGKRDLR